MKTVSNQQEANCHAHQIEHGRGAEGYALMTVRECCSDGRISPATFYRLVKNDPNFPDLVKIGSSTRVRSDEWRQYLAALATCNGEDA